MSKVQRLEGTGISAFTVNLLIEDIAKRHFDLSRDTCRVIMKTESDGFTTIDKPLFMVYEKSNNELIFYLKACALNAIPSLEYVAKINDQLQTATIDHCNFAYVIESYANSDMFFCATLPAKGTQISSMMIDITQDRCSADDLIAAYKMLGESLAQIHNIPVAVQNYRLGIPSYEGKINFEVFPEAEIVLQLLRKCYRACSETAFVSPCLIHGDLVPHNIFYDKPRHSLCFIDNEKISPGYAEYDFVKTILSLEFSGFKYGVPGSITSVAVDTFSDEYMNATSKSPLSKKLMTYFQYEFWLVKCMRYGQVHPYADDACQEILNKSTAYIRKRLENCIHS